MSTTVGSVVLRLDCTHYEYALHGCIPSRIIEGPLSCRSGSSHIHGAWRRTLALDYRVQSHYRPSVYCIKCSVVDRNSSPQLSYTLDSTLSTQTSSSTRIFCLHAWRFWPLIVCIYCRLIVFFQTTVYVHKIFLFFDRQVRAFSKNMSDTKRSSVYNSVCLTIGM